MHAHTPPLKSLFFIFSLFYSALSQSLTEAQINIVKQRLLQGATHSWEIGVRAQALLELSVSSFSSLTPSPPRSLPSPPSPSINASLADVYTIARTTVAALPPPPKNGSGQPFFIGDSSAADPASVGIAVLIANWTNFQSGQHDYDYAGAATAQVQYLFGPEVPKTSDGAISHRVSQVQLWSDFVYMVPPFLAYYGMTTNNQSMLQEAYTQIKLYRNHLSNSSANGLWQHIVLGSSGNDPGHWSTGNAWAAAGMLRVLGTLKRSVYAQNFANEINDLGSWVSEIHSGMYPHLQPNGLFKNYADESNHTNFDDATSSALLAATVYRLALLTGNKTFIPQAERTRAALFATNGTSAPSSPSPSPSSSNSSSAPASSAFAHTPYFTTSGWLSPVVDPLNVGSEGSQSPEGEAFVLMLYAAWRDWNTASNGPRINSATPGPSIPFTAALVGIWKHRLSGDCGVGLSGLVLTAVTVVVAGILGDLFV